MELLAAFKTDLDAGDAKGKTALHWASQEGASRRGAGPLEGRRGC